MYNLVHRVPHGLENLRELLEEHIHSQGLNALDKCSDSAINVSLYVEEAMKRVCSRMQSFSYSDSEIDRFPATEKRFLLLKLSQYEIFAIYKGSRVSSL